MRAIAKTEFKTWQRLPALTSGERENRSQFLRNIERGDCSRVVGTNENVRLLFPLPGGEGQGEGGRSTSFSQRKNFIDHD